LASTELSEAGNGCYCADNQGCIAGAFALAQQQDYIERNRHGEHHGIHHRTNAVMAGGYTKHGKRNRVAHNEGNKEAAVCEEAVDHLKFLLLDVVLMDEL